MMTTINQQSQQSESELVLLRDDSNGVATLTLNRPKQFNALNEALLAELQQQLDVIAKTEDIRVVVIRANGRAFCAGHDLKEMRTRPEQAYYDDLFVRCSQFMQTVTGIPQPVIAAVEGMATAAGCQLVATCDLAVASEDTQFAVSGINLGLFCSTPSVALSRNISTKRAFEMLFTGEFISAAQAQEWGLINHCVAANEIDSTLDRLCRSICAKPASTVSTGKKMFYRQIEKNIADAYHYAGQTMACNMMDEDTNEGISAFLEKRDPAWKTPGDL